MNLTLVVHLDQQLHPYHPTPNRPPNIAIEKEKQSSHVRSQTPYGSTKREGKRSSKDRVYVTRRNSNHNNTNRTNSNTNTDNNTNISNNNHHSSGNDMKNHDRAEGATSTPPEAATKLGVVYSFGELSDGPLQGDHDGKDINETNNDSKSDDASIDVNDGGFKTVSHPDTDNTNTTEDERDDNTNINYNNNRRKDTNIIHMYGIVSPSRTQTQAQVPSAQTRIGAKMSGDSDLSSHSGINVSLNKHSPETPIVDTNLSVHNFSRGSGGSRTAQDLINKYFPKSKRKNDRNIYRNSNGDRDNRDDRDRWKKAFINTK